MPLSFWNVCAYRFYLKSFLAWRQTPDYVKRRMLEDAGDRYTGLDQPGALVSALFRMAIFATANFLLFVVPGSVLPAQELGSTVVGVRVRATMDIPKRRIIGSLVRVDSAGLYVAPDAGGLLAFVPFDSLSRLERNIGTRSRGQAFGRGAKIGFFVGAGVGVVATSIAVATDLRSSSEIMIPASLIVGAFSVGLTVTTTLAGGALGLTARDRWQQVQLPP